MLQLNCSQRKQGIVQLNCSEETRGFQFAYEKMFLKNKKNKFCYNEDIRPHCDIVKNSVFSLKNLLAKESMECKHKPRLVNTFLDY